MTAACVGAAGIRVRHARLTEGQKKALRRLSERWVLPALPDDPCDAFARRAPLVMEIGAGTGDVSIDLARRHPENNHLVVEVYPGGVAQLLRRCERHGLENVRVLMQDAAAVMARCPERSLDKIMIFFPDPWPKKRHHKRRLLQLPFLSSVAAKLAPGGRVYVATDDASYAGHIEDAVSRSRLAKLGSSPAMLRPRWRQVTRYERKATLRGNLVHEWLLSQSPPGYGAARDDGA